MSKETRHLIYWWFQWLKRIIFTSYHIVNRRAYRKWKSNRSAYRDSFHMQILPELQAQEEAELF